MGDEQVAQTAPAGAAEEAPAASHAPEKPRILLFFDYACPFCYVDGFRVGRLAAAHDAMVLEVPFELRPAMPREGVSASAEGLGHSERVDEYLLRTADQEGFRMELMDYVPNTHDALVMGEVARDSGTDIHEAVHAAIFSAYFADGRDIGDRDILLDVAHATGLDADAVREAWDTGTYEERLTGFAGVARMLDVGQIPAALVCNELVIGLRPYEVLQQALDRCMLTRRSAEDATRA
jgi:predicted DsbA family dithiol-disulfide isomerase